MGTLLDILKLIFAPSYIKLFYRHTNAYLNMDEPVKF